MSKVKVKVFDIKQLSNLENWKKTKEKKYIAHFGLFNDRAHTLLTNQYTIEKYSISKEKPFVLSGVKDEQYPISYNELSSKFEYIDERAITKESIEQLIVERNGHKEIEWTRIKPVKNLALKWVYFVPDLYGELKINIKGIGLTINRIGIDHYKGDFILAEDAGGRPDLGAVRIVNGNLFPLMFSMKMFPNFKYIKYE